MEFLFFPPDDLSGAIGPYGEEIDPSAITEGELKLYIGFLYDRGLSFSSIERKIAVLKSFFKYLINEDIISKNPAYALIYPKKKKKLPVFLTPAQIEEICDFECRSFIDYRDKALLRMLFSTGARISEMEGALLKNFSHNNTRLKVMGKGSKERYIFVGKEAFRFFADYCRARKKKFGSLKGNLWVNNRGEALTQRGLFYIVTKRAKAAGYTGSVSPHTFRHSFATEVLNNGGDIKAVQDFLGHASISTTQVYTHTTRSRLKKVYEDFHPHGR
jgi:integrase/recombinase XerC